MIIKISLISWTVSFETSGGACRLLSRRDFMSDLLSKLSVSFLYGPNKDSLSWRSRAIPAARILLGCANVPYQLSDAKSSLLSVFWRGRTFSVAWVLWGYAKVRFHLFMAIWRLYYLAWGGRPRAIPVAQVSSIGYANVPSSFYGQIKTFVILEMSGYPCSPSSIGLRQRSLIFLWSN